ncbi:MAG TPA: hypothetical protein VGO93_18835 [Candidatus Xenobia bacterium]|jgi:hypothetical protein
MTRWILGGSWLLVLTVALGGVLRHEGLGVAGLAVVFTLLLLGTALLAATALLCWAFFPHHVVRNRQRLERMPARCMLTGMLAVATQIWLLTLCPHPILGLAFLLWDGLALAQGFPALAWLCGDRLLPAPHSGPRAAALGTAVIAWGGSVPLIGWALAMAGLFECLGTHFMVGRLAS